MNFLTNRPAAVLAVVAHPDDAEIMFYGTLRKWEAGGARICVAVLTEGRRGVSPELMRPGVRIEELQKAHSGTSFERRLFNFPDGRLTMDVQLTGTIDQLLREVRPQVVLTHPAFASNDHQDHLMLGRAVRNSVSRDRECSAILEGLPVQGFHEMSPNYFVDITEFEDAKVAALAAFRSQGGRAYLDESAVRRRDGHLAGVYAPAQAQLGHMYEAYRIVFAFG